jgi:hypothetical protein
LVEKVVVTLAFPPLSVACPNVRVPFLKVTDPVGNAPVEEVTFAVILTGCPATP